jgi:hypothetical protein
MKMVVLAYQMKDKWVEMVAYSLTYSSILITLMELVLQ